MNSRRSGPSALGLRSTPLRASQPPASRRSGPRLASVSGSTSVGSVKTSAGKGVMAVPFEADRYQRWALNGKASSPVDTTALACAVDRVQVCLCDRTALHPFEHGPPARDIGIWHKRSGDDEHG